MPAPIDIAAWSTLSCMTARRNFLLQSLSLGLVASGCASHHPESAELVVPNSVAVLGIVQRDGLKIPINEYRLASDLEVLLREDHRYSVMPFQQVRLALGKDRHELLLKRLAGSGELDSSDLHMLSKSRLPTKMAVVLAITGDEIESLPEERLQLRDNQGRLLNDRQHLILSTMRSVSLTATLVDLGVGRVRMHDNFQYQSVERKRYMSYSGSSFSGSVAATLANTVANGVRKPKWPAAPGLYGSFYELISDVAEDCGLLKN